MPNDEDRNLDIRHSCFVIPSSFEFRHPSFSIGRRAPSSRQTTTVDDGKPAQDYAAWRRGGGAERRLLSSAETTRPCETPFSTRSSNTVDVASSERGT